MPSRQLHRPIGWIVAVLVLALGPAVAMPQAHGSQTTPLLPDLVADPPDNVELQTSSTEGELSHTQGKPELLLRFNGYVHNIGPGAVDFRGSREKPSVSKQTEEEVEGHTENEEELPPKVEEELAAPPMKAFQRVFTTEEEETNIERAHIEQPSAAEMVYVNADGHHHWHLQRVARYSLWGAQKGAEVAPAQKVGFCLEDSEHIELGVGPSTKAYAEPARDFCQKYRPDATSLYEGISPGWRDRYESSLGFQWVDVSNVLPGEYWLREDVDPTGVIKETGGAKAPAYAAEPTIIPGFDAQAQTINVQSEEARAVTLTSKAWEEKGKALAAPQFTIASPPAHGTLTAVKGSRVTYTPNPGYSGRDSFTFSAADPNSEFPAHPSVATVAIKVGQEPTVAVEVGPQPQPQPQPTVSIEGAPSSMIAGTRAQLSAVTTNCPAVTWKANGGSITPSGGYTAPSETPPAGAAAVSASCAQSAEATRAISILGLSRPYATLIGRRLIMTTRVTEAGEVRIGADLHGRLVGACVTRSRANRTFSCGLSLAEGISLHAPISVVATLRFGHGVLRAVRPTAPVALITSRQPGKLGVRGRSAAWREIVGGPPVLQFQNSASRPVTAGQADVAIEGAPSSMIAGTSVRVSAVVGGASPQVTWTASGGSITAGGVYTAPALRPARRPVVLVARDRSGAEDRRAITILPVPASQAAPAVPPSAEGASLSTPSATGSTLGASASFSPVLGRPQAMLIGRKLIITTRVPAAGQIRLSAYLGRRRLGGCVAESPAGRSFTCRLTLGVHVAPNARIRVLAGLRSGARILRSARPAAPVAEMKMAAPSDLLANGANPSSWQFLCSP